MKFTAVLLSTFAVVAIAADTSYTKEQAACIKDAGADGPKIAECLGAAAPTEEMVNDTTKCAMDCVQGDGSPEQTEKYAACQQDCITKKFFVSTLGSDGSNTPATKAASSASSEATSATSAAAASKVTSTASDGTVETASSTPSSTKEDDATETSDGSAESESPDAEDSATGLQAAGALTGFVALFAALFAL